MEHVFTTIAADAEHESELWRDALLPDQERQLVAVFSPLGDERFALGLETIYEGYLAHYGRPRLFAPRDRDARLLLGDYLYAHGLVRIAALGDAVAVANLAELLSLCAQLRADGTDGDGAAWAATVTLLAASDGRLEEARASLRHGRNPAPLARLAETEAGTDAVARALALHRERVD